MQALFDLGNRIKTRVIERHGETITRVLDVLENRLVDLKEEWKKCSYGAVQGPYTNLTIALHHVKKQLNWDYCPEDTNGMENLDNRKRKLEYDIGMMYVGKYDNVCGDCPWCNTRRKPWPKWTNFSTEAGRVKAYDKSVLVMTRTKSTTEPHRIFNIHQIQPPYASSHI